MEGKSPNMRMVHSEWRNIPIQTALTAAMMNLYDRIVNKKVSYSAG